MTFKKSLRMRNKVPIERKIFKAYDIRGIYPRQINERSADAIARAFVVFLKPKTVVVARDVRISGPALLRSVTRALRESGVDVIDVGVVPADVFYFAVHRLKTDGGIFVSASHNPREWNGLNIAKRDARPISADTGLLKIYEYAVAGKSVIGRRFGKLSQRDIAGEYLDFIYSLEPLANPKPLRVVLNGNFGVSAQFFRELVRRFKLPFALIGLNEKPNGKFPKGPPNPLLPENRQEMLRVVKKKKADLGIAWDSDGDRSFFVDEKGNFVEGYFMTAILAAAVLKEHKGGTVMCDPRLIWATQDMVKKLGGHLVISKPGMTIIAERMRKERALFAGEMSGHFYFKDTFNRDSGMLPALILLNLMFREKKTLAEIARPFAARYFISGEINFELEDRAVVERIFARAKEKFRDGKHTQIDGISVEYPRWRFNLRASNTEPLIRLNVEAKDKALLRTRVRSLIALIRSEK